MGGGGGGGGSYTSWSSESLTNAVRVEQDRAVNTFQLQLAGYLSELLASYNARDHETVRERLGECKAVLGEDFESTFDHLYGGSVAKHTYVDGLSDIDSLLIVNDSRLEDLSAPIILQRMDDSLRGQLPAGVNVTHGAMAVTVSYPDGMDIQLLPAIRTPDGLKVPSSRTRGWSHINPDRFNEALTKRNQECGGKLVPTIKLAKAVLATLPEQYRLTGYHVESLAIAAFRGFTGEKTTSTMLPYLFQQAKDLILSPIRDQSGQSVHVDGYLGEANSVIRQYESRLIGNLAKRMTNASAAQSRAQWEALFFSEE
jgi:hypothetical protein